jgi:4-hydroxymandelate synthase
VEIQSIDHIELFVTEAEEAAAELCDRFGFVPAGRGGASTGLRGCESVLLRQRGITLLVTSATDPGHRAAEYVARHGDGVGVIALAVEDAEAAFAEAVGRGGVPVAPPEVFEGGDGKVVLASVIGFGDVEHRFVSRDRSDGSFLPMILETGRDCSGGLLREIDHIAVCVPAGALDGIVRCYEEVFGLRQVFEERIVVGSQAMDSKVVQDVGGKLTLTILEPDVAFDPGQIDAFIAAHEGAGVQHVAFLTEDILTAVSESADRGVRFLSTPSSYYEVLTSRLGSIGVPVEALRELNVLADRDHSGLLLQIFTESRHPRRTLFYELIDRRGAHTFGSNNIQALYEAVERQQAGDPIGLD